MKNSVPSKTCKDSKFFRINGARINKISNLTTELDDLERQKSTLAIQHKWSEIDDLKARSGCITHYKKRYFFNIEKSRNYSFKELHVAPEP